MSDRRSQGRPCRGEQQVGKEKILIAFREMLRSGSCHDLSRKSVAAYAGITPALISYYFPRKDDLIFEAVSPIVGMYAKEICALAESAHDSDCKLTRVIAILLRLYKEDGRLVDMYHDAIGHKSPDSTNEITRMTLALNKIFFPAIQSNDSQDLDMVILQGAVCGMCRFVAQANQSLISERGEVLSRDALNADNLLDRLASTFAGFVRQIPSTGVLLATPALAS